MSKAWKFGDDISTDAIIPGRFLVLNDPKELAKHCFENERPEFSKQVEEGDVVVAGENFGCGSSREHAPLALKGCGVSAIFAKTFARIFYRNAINVGLPVIGCEETCKLEDGEDVETNFDEGEIKSLSRDKVLKTTPPPSFIFSIIEEGGLIPYLKKGEKEVQN